LVEAVSGVVLPPVPWRIRKKSYLSHRLLVYQAPAVRARSAAYNAATMERRGLAQIYSYDADFDKLEGMARQEP
jgi:predicted nucleic acid-binding protein